MAANKYGEVLALIPARGGSKSVPRKNILPIMGKPLVAWTIEKALDAKYISRIIVSTDDWEIAEVSRKFGAEVPFLRPAHIAGDFSLDIEFHRHALEWLLDNESYSPDMVINLRPTTPARNPEVIDQAIKTFALSSKADSLRSVHLASETPYKMWLICHNGFMKPAAELPGIIEPYNQPRQKLPLVYWQDGYIDITRPDVIFKKDSTTGDYILPFVIEEPAYDIDYHESITLAETQLKCQQKDLSRAEKQMDIKYPS